MRRRPPAVAWVGASLVGVAAAACSSGTGGPPGTLSSGPYTYSAAVFAVNACDFAHGNAAAYNGRRQLITVTGSSLLFETASDPIVVAGASSFGATLSGGVFTAPVLSVFTDWTTTASQIASGYNPPLRSGYACQESDTYAVSGAVTGLNQFSRLTDVNFTMVAGTASQCIAAVNSAFAFGLTQFPCETKLSLEGAM